MNELEDAVQGIKGMSFPGSSVEDGTLYHDLPGMSFLHHRPNTEARVKQILEYVPVKGKRVLDIGCSAGGISLGLAAAGGEVTGVDVDVQALKVAQLAASQLGLDVRFEEMDILKGEIEEYDIIIWLSQWMWCVKEIDLWPAVDLLHTISRKGQTLIFESAADDGSAGMVGLSQEDVRAFLEYAAVQKTIVTVPPIEGWYHRPLHVCVTPETSWETPFSIISRTETNKVTKIFKDPMEAYFPGHNQTSYPWMKDREAEAMRRLKDQVGFPQLHQVGEDRVEMSWGGWRETVKGGRWGQARGILKKLGKAGIRHRDIKPGNLLALNGVLHLIDFSWCLFDDEEDTPDPAPEGLNCEAPDWIKWGNTDEEAMARSFDWIIKKEAECST